MKSSGSLFVRFLILGLSALIILIVGSKVFGFQSVVLTAAGIILATLLMVVMYTVAVLRDDKLLLEQDTPDLAYYLGFSLTVAALSLTFLSDLMLAQTHTDLTQAAAAKGQVINRALSQFGAGLLATLFGLCAKIYLASKQSTHAQDPTSVANKFRLELAEFSRLIDVTSNDLSSSIKNGCETINSASTQAAISINEMADKITASSCVISESFNADRIGSPVTAFLKEVDAITTPLVSLREGVGHLNAVVDGVRTSVEKYDLVIQASTNSIEAQTHMVRKAGNESEKLAQTFVDLIKETDSLQGSISNAATSIDSIAAPAADLAPTFEASYTAVAGLSKMSFELTDALKTNERALAVQTELLSQMNNTTKNVEASLTSLESKTNEFTSTFATGQQIVGEWTSELNLNRQAFSVASDAATTLGSVIRTSADTHKSSEELLTASSSALINFNNLINEASIELKRVTNSLEQSQGAAQLLNIRLTPLNEIAARTEPTLSALSASLDVTKNSISALNIATNELSTRLKTLNDNIDRV